jgi:hypothetical protein
MTEGFMGLVLYALARLTWTHDRFLSVALGASAIVHVFVPLFFGKAAQ